MRARVALVAVVLVLQPGLLSALGPRARPRVALVWFDPGRAFPSQFAAMATEVVSIFFRIGVEVTWKVAEQDTLTVPSEIQVILLNQDPPRPGGPQNALAMAPPIVLGETLRRPGPCPVLWVRLPAIERTLALRAGRASLPREGRILARAVARVIAHEIVHAVAPNLPHAQQGLMKERLLPAYLLSERTDLDAGTVRGLLAALERPDAPAPPTAAVPRSML